MLLLLSSMPSFPDSFLNGVSLSFIVHSFCEMSHFVTQLCFDGRANAQQPKLFVGMILILIFAEALALYGLIVGIILSSRAGQSRAE